MHKYFVQAISSLMLSTNIIVFGITLKPLIAGINISSFLYPGFFISIMLYVILGQSRDHL